MSLSICAACSNGRDESLDSSTANTFDASLPASLGSTMSELFHDEMRFTREDLSSGSTNCSDMLDETHIEDQIVRWPSELKDYFLKVLSKFPRPDLISQSVHGIYLVTHESMIDTKNNTTAAGLACDRGSDFKGIIFLNYRTIVEKRNEKGIGKWQNARTRSNKFIDVNEGDAAAITIMHEIFHAIDIKVFAHGSSENLKKRADFKSLSWVGNVSKFRRGAILALSDDNTMPSNSNHRCTDPAHTGFDLNGVADPRSLADELEYMQEKTNFIVPYTMASPAEDFAETLTVYFFGTYFQSWQKRTVSFDKKPLFVHDTEVILRTKSQHYEKSCAAAELVFGECRL